MNKMFISIVVLYCVSNNTLLQLITLASLYFQGRYGHTISVFCFCGILASPSEVSQRGDMIFRVIRVAQALCCVLSS